jgi:hypothetical protein
MSAAEAPKKEKKDKKRKSEAAAGATEEAVAPVAVAPPEGSASAEAVAMEVDGEQATKKAKKEKKEKSRKSVGGEGADGEEKVSRTFSFGYTGRERVGRESYKTFCSGDSLHEKSVLTNSPNSSSQQMPSLP